MIFLFNLKLSNDDAFLVSKVFVFSIIAWLANLEWFIKEGELSVYVGDEIALDISSLKVLSEDLGDDSGEDFGEKKRQFR